MTTLTTGIKVLDRILDGGIPAGRVVVLLASPASQSELFLYEMATVRPTTYLTTERPPSEIENCLSQTGLAPGTVAIHGIEGGDPFAEAMAVVSDLTAESTLIVDPMRRLEEFDADAYRDFLNAVKARTAETGSLTVLHCLNGAHVPAQRDLTAYLADIVFDLSTVVRGGSVQNQLAIPKFRRGHALPETINLDLTADVTIDVTRKIA